MTDQPTDLQRLREAADLMAQERAVYCPDVLRQAAAEMDRLRAALRRIRALAAQPPMDEKAHRHSIWCEATAALAFAAPADRSAPEDRETWLAEWKRKQREGGE